jgi:hypothetical protein
LLSFGRLDARRGKVFFLLSQRTVVVALPERGDMPMFKSLPAGIAILATIIACTAPARADGPATEPATPDCGAAALEASIGKAVVGTTAEDVTVGGAPVQSKGVVRVIMPGDMVTQDFSEDRLNLEVDEAGNLARATCG